MAPTINFVTSTMGAALQISPNLLTGKSSLFTDPGMGFFDAG
jgi:hypothetical protein